MSQLWPNRLLGRWCRWYTWERTILTLICRVAPGLWMKKKNLLFASAGPLPLQQMQCQARLTVCSDRTQIGIFVASGSIAVAKCHRTGAGFCAGSGVHGSSSSSGTAGTVPHVTPAKMSASFYVDVRKYKAHIFQVMFPLRCPSARIELTQRLI